MSVFIVCILIITLSIICKNQLVVAIPIGNLTCSFEQPNPCSAWETVASPWYYYQYERPTDIILTGPQQKNGKDGRFYIYVRPIPINSEDTAAIAQLKSLTIDPILNGVTCFRFWYYMYGEHVRNLTVTSDEGEVYFSEFGNKGATWHCGIFDASNFSGRKIIFNVYRNTLPYSVIAIDHIEIIPSTGCSQQNCENITITVPSTIETITNTLYKTSTMTTTTQETEGTNDPIIAVLPIVIGVPCSVLLIGGLIAGICIYKRRHSKEFEEAKKRQTDNNVYSGSPRQSETPLDYEEVYNELDESNMIDNNGYMDPVPYDEIGDVSLRKDGTAQYVNQPGKTPKSDEDYLEPTAGQNTPNGSLRHSSDDYLNFDNVPNGRTQSNGYLDVDRESIDADYEDGKS